MADYRIGIFQMKVTDRKPENLEKALGGIEEAAKRGCRLVVLPEMFLCPYEHKYFKEFAEFENDSYVLQKIKECAKLNSINVVAGSFPEKEDDKIYNTSYTVSETGSIINKYRKTHLFDVLIKDKITFIESDTLSPGDSINTFDTEIGRMGVGICYDIRFPELFKKLSLGGAEILVVPGAFNTITGPAHWRLLARSRAIDNQCFILMASPALNRDSSYHAYGHSLVCDPWGTILCEAGHNEELIDTKISLDYLKTVRAELPLLKHRRDDLY